MFLRVVSALLCVSVIGCKPKAGTSSLADIATANKVKTGMYTPEKARDVSSGFAGKSRTRSAAELQKLLGVDIATFGGQETYVVPTYEGDQVLVMKQGEARPLPIGGVSSSGKPFYLGASIASLGNGAALVGNTYVRLARANDPLKGTVSADGNETNMNLVYAVINSLGRQEDYLVSYLNQLDTVGGGKTVRLLKVGNNIIEAKTGESVIEFRELGNQVWRVYGVYSDRHFQHGSVVWSPDMRKFYSIRARGEKTIEWAKQDDNSMDVVKEDVSVTVPSAVKSLLADNLSDAKNLELTGPMPGTSARRAFALSKRLVKVRATGMKLSGDARELAPSDDKSPEYDAFFDAEPVSQSFGLAGGGQPYSGNARYPTGAVIDLGGGITGKVVSPTSNTTTPGGWFTSSQSVNKTYVQTASGTIRELTSTNGGAVEQRFLNQYDIKQMQASSAAELASPAQAQREQAYRGAIADSNKAAQALEANADNLGNKYGTFQGLATNVVLPVATAGVAAKVGDAMAAGAAATNAASAANGVTVSAAKLAEQVASKAVTENLIQSTGSTAQYAVSSAIAGKADAGGGATTSVDFATNPLFGAIAPGNVYAGAAQAALSTAVGEGVNGAQGNVDLTKSGLAVATAGLGGAANSVLPGSGVAVQIVGDGAGLGVDYNRMNEAAARTDAAFNDYKAPRDQNQAMNSILANATFPEPEASPQSQPQETAPVQEAAPVQQEAPAQGSSEGF